MTVAWRTTDLTTMCLKQAIDDYSWDTGEARLCGDGYGDENGRRFVLTAEQSHPDAFLVFDDPVWGGQSPYDEPYEFTVEAIQHWIGIGVRRTPSISRRGTFVATVSTGDNRPAPDGLRAQMTLRWDRQSRMRWASSRSGKLRFRMRLPRSARGKVVRLTVRRDEDSAYQASSAGPLSVRVR
ncbi:hypothetical protein [Conexibacter arvalis]|uniref:Uncharacterized protein n=1 Tax=Conexibacter arvalis TaxID=912552 RepID=A0A840IB22_9ACTN|nr:hypothetical protein [Conexibacter arvalis]MBB4661443.1 hypothetical protein [Conexibacter arvalis]